MIHQYRIARFLFVLLAVICSMQSFAGVEPYQNQLKGTIKKGDSLIVKDEKFRNPDFDWDEITNRTVKNFLSFQLTYDTPVVMNKAFSCEVDLKVEYFSTPDQAEPVTINSVKLKINFSPETGATYKAKDVYAFSNGYWVKITVTNISSPELGDKPPPVLQLTSQVVIDRDYVYHSEKSIEFSGTFSGTSSDNSAGASTLMNARSVSDGSTINDYFLHLRWGIIPGAEYDIEWAVFDENVTDKQALINQILANQPLDAGLLDGLFRNNATRVNTSGNSYDISMVYTAKYILVRMRQVHYINGFRNEDEWDYKVTDAGGNPTGYAIWPIHAWHEENINWQYAASFSEEGKKKEMISYFDGSLRNRQMVAINNTDQVAVVQEIVYDKFGRSAATILPAPTNDNKFHYYPDFNLNESGASYDYINLEGTVGQLCMNTPRPMGKTNGASKYYSENNYLLSLNPSDPGYRNYNQYIPQAEGYPMSVAQYVNDNTGRIRVEGGAGPAFQPGKDVNGKGVTRYYYGKPEPYELDRLFGNDVGYAHHYKKNMAVDPNGQINLTYLNAGGKTIATAITGGTPDGMDPLPSQPTPQPKTFTILRPSQFTFDATALSLYANTTYLNSVQDATATFNYDIQKLLYSYQGANFQICSNCYYDLTIRVTNDCGQELRKITSPVGSLAGDCNFAGTAPDPFTVEFHQIGEYYISFEFKLSNKAIDDYTDTYIKQRQDNGSLRTELDFVKDYLNSSDFTGCFNECTTCEAALGTFIEFSQAVKSKLTEDNVVYDPLDPVLNGMLQAKYDALRSNCIALKANCMVSSCSKYEQVMLDDVSPGGQYALFGMNPFMALEADINVIVKHWRNDVFATQAPGSADYEAEAIYDENGIKTSPYDQNFTLEMLVKYWRAEWATKFLQYHPEKCKLDFCNANSDYFRWDDQVQQLIKKATDIPSIPGASSGLQYSYTNAAWLLDQDPFFKTGAPGNNYINDMRSDLNNFSSRIMSVSAQGAAVKSLTQVIDYLMYCSDLDGNTNTGIGNSWNDCAPIAGCRVPDKEWNQYKEFYFQVKQKYYQIARNNGPCAGQCPVGAPLTPAGSSCATTMDFSIARVVEEVNTCSAGNQKVRISYAKGAAIRPMTVELYYPAEYNSYSSVNTINFSPGESEKDICIAGAIVVPSIKIKAVTCTGPLEPGGCIAGSITGQLNVIAGTQQVTGNKFYAFNTTTGVETTYYIVPGKQNEPPANADYCSDGTIIVKEFYNCLKLLMPNSSIPMQFFNVWAIGCQRNLCPNPVTYNVLKQIDAYTFYGNGKNYCINLQNGGGNNSCTGTTTAYYECIKVNIGSTGGSLVFTNARVTESSICTGSEVPYNASQQVTPTVFIGTDGNYFQIFPETSQNDGLSPTYCNYTITREWHRCFFVNFNGTILPFYNATVFKCNPVPPCRYQLTVDSEDPNRPNVFYHQTAHYLETIHVFPGVRTVTPDINQYCPADASWSFYDCYTVKIPATNQVKSYQNVWVITCIGAFTGKVKSPVVYSMLVQNSQQLQPSKDRQVVASHTGKYAFAPYGTTLMDIFTGGKSGKTNRSDSTGKAQERGPFCSLVGYSREFNIEFTGQTCANGNIARINSYDPLCNTQTANFVIYSSHTTGVYEPMYNGTMASGQSEIMVCIPSGHGNDRNEFKACAEIIGECPPPCPEAYLYKKSRFPEFSLAVGQFDLQAMQNENNGLIADQIKTNCEAQADTWMKKLDECLAQYSPAQRQALKLKLIEVCINGGDLDHPYGSSTVKPGVTSTASFKEAMIQVLGLGALTMTCNPWLLDEPHPYDPKQQSVSKTITSTNVSLCARLQELQSATGGDLYDYLKGKYGNAMNLTRAQLEVLRKSCNNCHYILEQDIPLPVFLEPGATGCVTASVYNTVKSELAGQMGGNLDVNHPNYPDVMANYLNHRWGFSMGYHRYQAYETQLQSDPLAVLCNNPPYTEVEVDRYTCVKTIVAAAIVNGRRDYDQYIAEEKRLFRMNYVNTCGKAQANSKLNIEQQTYHYTLFYYDQADNLVRTVPPEGVRVLADEELNLVDEFRKTDEVVDCSAFGTPATESKTVALNGFSSALQSNGVKSMELWLNGSGANRQLRFITPDNKYLYQAAINNNKLWVELYTMVPAPNAADGIAIILSNQAVADITGITLQPWSHVFLQSNDFTGTPWSLYLDGRKLTMVPNASANPFEWEIGATSSGLVLPAEDMGVVKHLRIYNRLASDAEISTNYSNLCKSPEGQLSIRSNPQVMWARFGLPSSCNNTTDTRVVGNRGALQVNGNLNANYGLAFNDINNSFTVEMWVKPQTTHENDNESKTGLDGLTGQKYVIYPTSYSAASGKAGMGISVGTNGISVYEHADGYMPPLLVWPGSVTTWTHIAVVYNNGTPTLYVNGNFAKTGLPSNKQVSPSYNFCSGPYGNMTGNLDEVRIWNIARSQADINADHRRSIPPSTAGLVAYWPMSREDGAVLYDMSCAHIPVKLNSNYNWASVASPVVDVVPLEYSVQGIFPRHRLVTSYSYNSSNKVVQQKSPDGGHSYFWYDQLGRVIASQDQEQRTPYNGENPNRYTYNTYELTMGRLLEVGEKSNGQVLPGPGYLDQATYNQFLSSGNNAQITQTFYDKVPAAGSGIQTGLLQENLRKRISAKFYKETSASPISQATYYSYDLSGNVKTLWQQVDGLGLKRLDYEYDLASGKMNFVSYQHGENDQFYYEYKYDADNRIIESYSGTLANISPRGSSLLNKQLDAFYRYYLHGPLARTELGENKVQGLDYAYTLRGWLKGVNGHKLNAIAEIGNDGNSGNNPMAKDVMAYTLGYFQNDYKPIGGTGAGAFSMPYTSQSGDITGNDMFNGNISNTTVALDKFRNADPVGYTYRYDQLNRLKEMRYHPLTSALLTWNNSSVDNNTYKETITYDGNGNINTYVRNGANTANMDVLMDNLTYNYKKEIDYVINKEYLVSNQLQHVHDEVGNDIYKASVNGIDDMDKQDPGNYQYDNIGNLIADFKAGINKITWNIHGKLRSIHKTDGTTIYYAYDNANNRVKKVVNANEGSTTTWYSRDANGKSIAVYSDKQEGQTGTWWKEQHLYGLNRLGMWTPGINIASTDGTAQWGILGKKTYELTNHLHNVLATITDKKIAVFSSGDGSVSYYAPEVTNMQDYYPFGMIMPGRKWSQATYRYGFNGKENDNDVKGEGNQQDYGERVYDPRLGKFLSVDPLTEDYPELTPYQFGSNMPIAAIDLDGLEAVVVITGQTTRLGKESSHHGYYYMYKVKIYENMTLDQYNQAVKSGTLQAPTATTELTRDALYKKGSNKRYGSSNETPPGTYWLTYHPKGLGSHRYKIKVSDTKNGDEIKGSDGKREGVRVHQWTAHGSEGCFTTGVNDKSGESVEKNVLNKIPSLTSGEDVRLIVEERKVKYDDKMKKWRGVENKDGTAPSPSVSPSAAKPVKLAPTPWDIQPAKPQDGANKADWRKFDLTLPSQKAASDNTSNQIPANTAQPGRSSN